MSASHRAAQSSLRSALVRAGSCALFGCAFIGLSVPDPAHADNVRGAWDPQVYQWPLIPVHAVVTPDMRVMTYGTDGVGRQTGYFVYDVWDISADPSSGHLTLENVTATDIFCGSQLVLPQGGQVFLAGGDNWTGSGTTNTGNNNTNLLDLSTTVLSRGNNINRARWYSTSSVLLNGEVLIQGGSGGTDFPEIRALDGTFRLLSGASTGSLDFMYPRNFIAPDGRVFGYDSAGRMYYLNTAGAGSITMAGQLAAPYRGNDASAAMFRPGRILQFGGSSNGAVVIDITGSTPVVTPTQSMSSQRRLVNGAILPDGKVLATGGSSVWNQLTNVNNSAEIWNPATGTWMRGPDGQRARLYHSISLLLPDGRVLVGGGGAPGPQNNLNVEIYNPPYLYDASGERAVQPRIASAPAEMEIGETFYLELEDASDISRVTMVKNGSVTHSWNMEQRFVELPFVREGSLLKVQAPTRAADAPPGFWMIFALNEQGVPSHARITKVNVASNWNPAITPTLAETGDLSGTLGVATQLQLAASDPNQDEIAFSASGLPTGLSLNSVTGLISGIPTTSGNYHVVVTASDGINAASRSFLWTILDPAPLLVEVSQQVTPSLAGSEITYSASASNGQNPRFSWYFDDGSPATNWSSTPSTRHVFTEAGVYYVTVTAVDDRGVQVSETFVQTVHLALTSNRPTASSNIVVEQPQSGNARVWVVNQDNNSVTVFDSVTNARLAEISVGAAPRTIAIAPNRSIWVTNKASASISVIDPGTRRVVQTVSLPRASQPFGLAFTPTGSAAYVTLEGTGRLLRLNPSTGATLASIEVGPNPRHVSVSADGTSVYVSRFITPLLPGESTGTVQTQLGGGEIVVVNATSSSVVNTIRLAHSDRQDFESQGRGVPNYLGAAVISPDGTQAWVPSKQDNIARGALRDGLNLNFQNTVRAISSRVDLSAGNEDLAARIDHDNSSFSSAVAFDPRGIYLFVALETSREVAIVDAHGQWEIFRFDVGRAPQGLAISADGSRLFVNNFMDRTVGVFDLKPLLQSGRTEVPALATLSAVTDDRLSAQVLAGKQLFYDARDPRLARDRYMSCASCHNDGGHDGRVWDLTGMGEGLRNTISLTGRASTSHGFLHWSANFDELQDFEGQIRGLAGGTGLMSDADFASRNAPLGAPKAGASADLDALAAYVASLSTFANTPYRTSNGALTTEGARGRTVFETAGCGACHSGTKFTNSAAATLQNIGTIKPASGLRLGGTLTGIDPPTLRDVWSTAPYLHDGSAATLADAVRAHTSVSLSSADQTSLVAYLQQIGAEEASAPPPPVLGNGLTGRYFTNTSLSGSARLTRVEAVDFDWGSHSPGAGIASDNFSVRWSGQFTAPSSGAFRFQTVSDDGVRLYVNGQRVINNWTQHSAKTDTSSSINLVAGRKYTIRMEYYEARGSAVAKLLWRLPNSSTYQPIPKQYLYGD